MYRYEDEKNYILTDEGAKDVTLTWERVRPILEKAGAIRADVIMEHAKTSDSWRKLAVVDRLVEIGLIIQVPYPSSSQHKIYRSGR